MSHQTYAARVAEAEQRHQIRLIEARVARVAQSCAAEAEYRRTYDPHGRDLGPNAIYWQGLAEADKRYAKAVGESARIRMADFDEAYTAYRDGGQCRMAR